MSRLSLNNTLLDLHSPSTIASNRGYSAHVYLSGVLVDGVPREVIILVSTDKGPRLPDGARVRAVGRAVLVGDIVLARDPVLTVSTDDDAETSLAATMHDLEISGESIVSRAEPGQTPRAGLEVVVTDAPVNIVHKMCCGSELARV